MIEIWLLRRSFGHYEVRNVSENQVIDANREASDSTGRERSVMSRGIASGKFLKGIRYQRGIVTTWAQESGAESVVLDVWFNTHISPASIGNPVNIRDKRHKSNAWDTCEVYLHFSGARISAPLFISTLGLTSREMPKESVIIVTIAGLCVGGGIGAEQDGWQLFFRNDNDKMADKK